MILRRIALSFLVTAIAGSTCVFAQGRGGGGGPAAPGGTTTTTVTTTTDYTVGPVGVGSTETIQINVANLAANPTTGVAASCTGSITFNNLAGNPIGTSTSFTATAGQIVSAALPFSKINASTTARTEVIGVISHTTTTSSPEAPCDLHYSLETYDSTTGATHVYVSGAAVATPAIAILAGGGAGH